MLADSESARASSAGPSNRRLCRRLTSALLIAATFAIIQFSGCMDRYFFYPERDPFVTPAGVEDVTFTTPDGVSLHGWFVPAPGASAEHPAPAILHVHGNAGNVSYHTQLDFLAQQGISVFTFDYRGYGRSQAAGISRAAYLSDARAAWKYLLSRADVDRSRCAIVGVSIGTTFASALATEAPEARALVLFSPFASWRRIAHTHAPILGPLLVRPAPDPEEQAARLGKRPLLIIHGDRDNVIPIAHGQRVAKAAETAGVPVEFFPVSRAGHNDLMVEEAETRTTSFLHAAFAPVSTAKEPIRR